MAISSKTLEELITGIREIFNSEDINVDLYMSLQNKVYTMFKTDMSWNAEEINASSRFVYMCRRIYAHVIEFLKDYVREKYHIDYTIRSDEEYLANYTEEVYKFKRNSKILEGICAPVHFYWMNSVEKQLKKKPLNMYDIALSIWDNGILHRSFPILNETILNLITMDRSGDTIDKDLLRNGILSYTEQTQGEKTQSDFTISPYKKQFIKQFLKKTMYFYTQLANDNITKYCLRDYVLFVRKRINEERDRMLALCLPVNWNLVEQVDEICEEALIAQKFEYLSKEFMQLLRSGNGKDAEVAYNFFKDFHYNSDAANIFKRCVNSEGYNAIRNCDVKNCGKKPACKYAEVVAEVLNKYNDFVMAHFPIDQDMVRALSNATKKFFNHNIFTVAKCKNPDLINFNEYRCSLEECYELVYLEKVENGE
ncbi:cullin homolog 1-like [Teleopsis dalmanni]|uniref:cullin homolog 1-like n=1 Tax=Teleopsis dalmanni TaxID=139649 RepID=UPI0018CE225C|nr:cullin homolog 1-like [Teleopsis dalmanni]